MKTIKKKDLVERKEQLRQELLQKVNPRELAKQKAEAYRAYVLDVLENLKEVVKSAKFENKKSLMFFSPAGDEMGMDNYVINFGVNKESDFSEAVEYLDEMLRFARGEFEIDEFDEPQV